MSLLVTVDMSKLQTSVKVFARESCEFEQALVNLAKRFRDVRPLESRNKREGWYWAKVIKVGIDLNTGERMQKGPYHARTRDKEWALRYRKQTGAQVVIVKERK